MATEIIIGKKRSVAWHETFMKMALLVRERSHCLIMPVGAVIASLEEGNQTILSMGYNGPPRGIKHCDEHGCSNFVKENGELKKKEDGLCIGAHSEINAISNAARFGIRIEGAYLYVTCSPCFQCAKAIINAGLRGIFWLEKYSELNGKPSAAKEEAAAIALIKKAKGKDGCRRLTFEGDSVKITC